MRVGTLQSHLWFNATPSMGNVNVHNELTTDDDKATARAKLKMKIQ